MSAARRSGPEAEASEPAAESLRYWYAARGAARTPMPAHVPAAARTMSLFEAFARNKQVFGGAAAEPAAPAPARARRRSAGAR